MFRRKSSLIFYIISILLAQSRKTIRNGSPWSAKYVQSFSRLSSRLFNSFSYLEFLFSFQDNYRFVLDYKCAMGSGMIKNMLSGKFSNPILLRSDSDSDSLLLFFPSHSPSILVTQRRILWGREQHSKDLGSVSIRIWNSSFEICFLMLFFLFPFRTLCLCKSSNLFSHLNDSSVSSNHSGVVLEKVVEYLIWKTKYQDVKESEVPSFQNRIPPEISLELWVYVIAKI